MLTLLLVSSTAWSADQKYTVAVVSAGEHVSNAQVILWQAKPGKSPKKLAQSRTTEAGHAQFDSLAAPDSGFLYLTSNGGDIDGVAIARYAGLAVLDGGLAGPITINELSTIGSLWPLVSQFTVGSGISGSANGLLLGS